MSGIWTKATTCTLMAAALGCAGSPPPSTTKMPAASVAAPTVAAPAVAVAPASALPRLSGEAGPDSEGDSDHHRLEIDLTLGKCASSEEYDNYTETYSGPCHLVGRDGPWTKVAFDGQLDVYDAGKTSRKPYQDTLDVAVLGDLPADEQAMWLEGEDPARSPEADAARRRTCFVADHRLYC